MRFISIFIATLLMTTFSYAKQSTVWIGMSAPKHGEPVGIYRATLDTETGNLTEPTLVAPIGDPEYLALHPNGKRLYAAIRLPNGEGGVAAYEISDDKQSLTLLNTMPTGSGGACHLTVDRSGTCLFTAQYGRGSISVLPLAADGKLLPHSAVIQHSGNGPDKMRQDGPHPHFVGIDPQNQYLLVPDLGVDKIVIYKLDSDKCGLEPHGAGICPPAAGPRHLVFHPNGRFVYVVNEMAITVTVFEFDPAAGTLKEIQTIEALPEKDRKLPSTAAGICIHPSGKFLYTSARNDDTITTFSIDPNTGRLTFVEREPIRGSHPRSFNLDPSGKWLLASGRDTNSIAVFRIDQQTGRLVFTDKVVESPSPICIEVQPME